MYIGGMQMTPRAEIRAVANGRAARHDAHAARRRRGVFSGSVSLSKNGQRPWSIDASDDVAEAEAEQDALLHPGVDAPAGRRRRVGLGGAHLAARQRRPQLGERARAASSSASALAAVREAARSIVRRCRASCTLARRGRRATTGSAEQLALSTRSDLLAATPSAAAPSAAGSAPRSRPIIAIAAFTGIGFDSTKLTCISGSSAWCTARAAAKSPRSAASTMLHHLGRDLVRRHRDDAAAADRHQRQRQRVVAREHEEVRRHGAARSRTSASCCRTLP